MAFTVRDFHDLVVIMDTQPHWKAEMRRLILSDDILSLPQELRDLAASVRSLSEAQKKYEIHSEERFDRVDNEIAGTKTDLSEFKANTAERFDRVDSEIAGVKTDLSEFKANTAERFDRVDSEITGLKTDVSQLKTDVSQLKTDVSQLKTDVGGLKGSNLERQFRERPFVYLNRFALRLQIVSDAELATMLENAFEEGLLTDEEVEDAKLADVVARGRSKKDRSPLYLVAEISSVVDLHDLERAARRAAIIAKASKIITLPVIGGEKIDSQVQQRATQSGVGWVISRAEN